MERTGYTKVVFSLNFHLLIIVGALLGPDVKKLVTKENIRKFGEVFQSLELTVSSENGTSRVECFGVKCDKCYQLYTVNRSF